MYVREETREGWKEREKGCVCDGKVKEEKEREDCVC